MVCACAAFYHARMIARALFSFALLVAGCGGLCSSRGRLAVVAVLFDEGNADDALGLLRARLPAREGQAPAVDGTIDPFSLIPSDAGYYRYSGSLTTPPCSEDVTWLVLRAPRTVSK